MHTIAEPAKRSSSAHTDSLGCRRAGKLVSCPWPGFAHSVTRLIQRCSEPYTSTWSNNVPFKVPFCHCCVRLSHALARKFPHLASVNPYIGSALASGGPDGCPAAAHLPREPGGAAAEGAVGVSGFAFQGTNAHVIVSRRACLLLFVLPSMLYDLLKTDSGML